MLRRLVRWLAVAFLLSVGAAYAAINLAGHDPVRWHADPATVALRGTPNEYLAAPPGTTAAPPHLETGVVGEAPRALLVHFDAVARAQPRTRPVAGDLDSLMLTYVQRSAVVGFPDYVTVKAVPLGEGAGLIVYSRSRYGRDDFGVNRRRVHAWLGELGAAFVPPQTPGQPSASGS